MSLYQRQKWQLVVLTKCIFFLSFSCGSSPPLAAGHSTTTGWNRRHSASAYGPQFSILPSLWTFSIACMLLLPSSKCSAGSDRIAHDWQCQITCTRTLVTTGSRECLTAQVNRSGGSLGHTPTDLKESRGDKQNVDPSVWGLQRKTNLLACVPWRITLYNARLIKDVNEKNLWYQEF